MFPDTPWNHSVGLACIHLWLQTIEHFVKWSLNQKGVYCSFTRSWEVRTIKVGLETQQTVVEDQTLPPSLAGQVFPFVDAALKLFPSCLTPSFLRTAEVLSPVSLLPTVGSPLEWPVQRVTK